MYENRYKKKQNNGMKKLNWGWFLCSPDYRFILSISDSCVQCWLKIYRFGLNKETRLQKMTRDQSYVWVCLMLSDTYMDIYQTNIWIFTIKKVQINPIVKTINIQLSLMMYCINHRSHSALLSISGKASRKRNNHFTSPHVSLSVFLLL